MHKSAWLNICICTKRIFMFSICGGQKRTSDFIVPESQMVVSYHLGAVNQTWILNLNLLNHLFSSQFFLKLLLLLFIKMRKIGPLHGYKTT